MKIVIIDSDYIKYLEKFSNNVKSNKNSKRPYVGIILKINEFSYFAPLGSPKPKHEKMKELIDFIKMDEGRLGVINLNNMIPVPIKLIKAINFEKMDNNYFRLIKKQERWIQKNKEIITKKSLNLYKLIINRKNTIFHKRCNDFKFLETKSLYYEK